MPQEMTFLLTENGKTKTGLSYFTKCFGPKILASQITTSMNLNYPLCLIVTYQHYFERCASESLLIQYLQEQHYRFRNEDHKAIAMRTGGSKLLKSGKETL
ncbi:hypothetical protein ACTXT7_014311 [Hymenolepis weldensis]